MDIVWHKGHVPRRMEQTDNGDFDRSANMDYTWGQCSLGTFTVDVCVAGKITEKFPAEVVNDYVEITLYNAGYDDAIFCCAFNQDGLQCVHIDTSFLIDYAGTVIAPRSDSGMRTFVAVLMMNLNEQGLFAQIRGKQSL